MSSQREWKPGDVVTATVNGRPNVRVIAGWSKCDPQLRWGELSTRWADGDDDECWFMPHSVTDHRPLVVIDPEDEACLRRIGDLLVAADRGYDDESWLDLQVALREFANPKPPKPDEPMGLGAVVEDADGSCWVRAGRTHRKGDDWRCVDGEGVGHWSMWSDIVAVTVLSEGVVQP